MPVAARDEAPGDSIGFNGGRGGTRRKLPAHLTPFDMKRLAGVLSTPEILQVLARWKVRHPSDIPLSHKVERSYLLDLLIQCEGALNEVLRVVTAKGGKRRTMQGTISHENLKVVGDRSRTPAYLSVLREVQDVVDTGPQVHLPPLGHQGSGGPAAQAPPGGRQSAPPSTRAHGGGGSGGFAGALKPFSAGNTMGRLDEEGGGGLDESLTHAVGGGGGGEGGDTEARRKRRRERRESRRRAGAGSVEGGGGSIAQPGDTGGIRVGGKRTVTTLSKAQLSEKLQSLTAELEAARVERERYTMDLARKGMLAVTMDSQLNFPVMRGECMRMANVSRNLQAVQGYNNQRHNGKMEGLLVDETLKKVKHHVSPSTHSLCL